MRTMLFLLSGVLLLAVFFILAKLFSGPFPRAPATALAGFAIAWLGVAAFNMWAGVAKAGYSVAEEAPIFLVIFVVPAALAVVIKWKFF